MFQNIRNK